MHKPIPPGFQEAVAIASATGTAGDLALLASEAHGFDWEIEGLRLVARTQLEKQQIRAASLTWSAILQIDPGDAEAKLALDTAPQRLRDVSSSDAARKRVLLFAGHRIDEPGRHRPRFPTEKEQVARQAILSGVEDERAAAGEIGHGIAGGASGADILFHEICQQLEIPTQLYLALPADQFIVHSVAPADAMWVERFNRILARSPTRVLQTTEEMPLWLSGKRDYSVWQRDNLWMLYNALVHGANNVTVIALWDGAASDRPGGTADLVQQAQSRGARTVVLDTKLLFGL
ncbi:MAG TPA: hypothetical protein VMH32_19780 [Burkholderiales bacterium]|nr:hypothetical protein [Burkholderiales bacterium]